MHLFLAILGLAAYAEAFYEGNINYNSPSRRHDHFGIDLPKVEKRLVNEHKLLPCGAAPVLNFTHSVASGDPSECSIILWTRLAPINNATQKSPICVTYQVSSSPAMKDTITKGTAYTSSDIDYTVKVEATGLKAFTQYWYQFRSCDGSISSPIGRTKTTPGPNDEVKGNIRLAVYSCANHRTFPCYVGVVKE